MDLVKALPLQLLHGLLHLQLVYGGGAHQGTFTVEGGHPTLIHVIEVIAAHLFSPQSHGRDLMRFGRVHPTPVHAE